MAGWGVVSSRDGKCGERCVILQFLHPASQIGRGEHGELRFRVECEDAGELQVRVVCERSHSLRLAVRNGNLDSMSLPIGFDDDAEPFLV